MIKAQKVKIILKLQFLKKINLYRVLKGIQPDIAIFASLNYLLIFSTATIKAW